MCLIFKWDHGNIVVTGKIRRCLWQHRNRMCFRHFGVLWLLYV